jgi:hypothetical protein
LNVATASAPRYVPALVLNADFRPLSYYPLSLWGWQDAVKAVFLERVNIVSEYDRAVRSPSLEMKLPSVVSLKTYVRPARYPAFTRLTCSCATVHVPKLRRRSGSDLRPSRAPLARRHDAVGERHHGLRAMQSDEGRQAARRGENASGAEALSPDGVRAPPQRPAVPAELSA